MVHASLYSNMASPDLEGPDFEPQYLSALETNAQSPFKELASEKDSLAQASGNPHRPAYQSASDRLDLFAESLPSLRPGAIVFTPQARVATPIAAAASNPDKAGRQQVEEYVEHTFRHQPPERRVESLAKQRYPSTAIQYIQSPDDGLLQIACRLGNYRYNHKDFEHVFESAYQLVQRSLNQIKVSAMSEAADSEEEKILVGAMVARLDSHTNDNFWPSQSDGIEMSFTSSDCYYTFQMILVHLLVPRFS